MLGSVFSFCCDPLIFLIKLPRTPLVSTSIPFTLPALGEILTSWPTHSLVVPCPCVLIEIIIKVYLPMIHFTIPVYIFLFSSATEKNQTSVYLVLFKHRVKLTKLGLVCTLFHSLCISLGMRKTMERVCTTSFVHTRKIEPKNFGSNTSPIHRKITIMGS
jgi:hypothetical protein